MNASQTQTLKTQLDETRRRLREAEQEVLALESHLRAIAKEGHAKDCRYFNGFDMACTCGFDQEECQNLECRRTGKCIGTTPCRTVSPPR